MCFKFKDNFSYFGEYRELKNEVIDKFHIDFYTV